MDEQEARLKYSQNSNGHLQERSFNTQKNLLWLMEDHKGECVRSHQRLQNSHMLTTCLTSVSAAVSPLEKKYTFKTYYYYY